MKKTITLLTFACMLFAGSRLSAQSFTLPHDTVMCNLNLSDNWHNDITNTTPSAITIEWKAIATDFPADWQSIVGFCDAFNCVSGTAVWPPAAGTLHEAAYAGPAGTASDFKMTLPLTTSSTLGTYYIKVRINNKYVASDTAIATFIATRSTTGVSVVRTVGDVSMYPNPATNTLNLVYDAVADVKNIAIYSIIGRQLNVFRVTDNNSASLNLENIPAGVYFVRLMNSHGDVVTTRKFTKQ